MKSQEVIALSLLDLVPNLLSVLSLVLDLKSGELRMLHLSQQTALVAKVPDVVDVYKLQRYFYAVVRLIHNFLARFTEMMLEDIAFNPGTLHCTEAFNIRIKANRSHKEFDFWSTRYVHCI